MSNRTSDIIARSERFGAHNYLPLPIVLVKGEGARVWDIEGKEYLDFLSCYSALNFGHGHPDLLATLTQQAQRLAVCSRAFHSEELALFCEALAKFSGFERALPMNSGTEAVETALKVARKWGYERKGITPDRAKILTFSNNFHGRSISIVSFSSEPLYRDGFGPFTPGFESLPFGDLHRISQAIDDNTVAVLLEPIQAEAGILLPPPGFLKGLRELCTTKRVLFLLDEIQTGLGRTGKNFCFEHEGIRPDILILGKSLGGGLLPVSAIVTSSDIMDVIRPGEHGSTFGGNPLAAAVGRRALQLLSTGGFTARAAQMEGEIRAVLEAKPLPQVRAIRGRGALFGVELHPSAGGARRYCEELARRGVLCKETHDHVIRIAPPLVMNTQELRQGLDTLVETVVALAN